MADFTTLYQEADWATREFFAPKVQDVVFNSNATTAILRQNASTMSSGNVIQGFSLYKKGTKGGFFGRADSFEHEFEQQFGAAQWPLQNLTEPVALFVTDLLDNEGDQNRRFELIMHQNMAAAKTMADTFGAALYSLSYRNTNPNFIDSLDHAVSDQTGSGDETTFDASYANISRTDEATWRANVDDTVAMFSVGDLNDLWLDCSEGTDQPTLVVSNNKAFSYYYDELTPIQRQSSDELLGKGGFKAVMFNGAPWVIDSHCPSSDRSVPTGAPYGTAPSSEYIYLFNTNVMEVKAHRRAFFSFWGVKEPIDQWAVVGRYFFRGNVPVYNPRFCGKMTNLTG